MDRPCLLHNISYLQRNKKIKLTYEFTYLEILDVDQKKTVNHVSETTLKRVSFYAAAMEFKNTLIKKKLNEVLIRNKCLVTYLFITQYTLFLIQAVLL